MNEKPDLFWDASNPEYSYSDPSEILDEFAYGEIVEIQRAVRLSNVFVVRMPVPGSDETEDKEFDDAGTAAVWVERRKAETPVADDLDT